MSNHEAASWEQALRRGAMDKPAFSEDMKRSVLEAADRPAARKAGQLLRYASIPAIVCLAIVLIATYGPAIAPGVNETAAGRSYGTFGIHYETLQAELRGRNEHITSNMPVLLRSLSDQVHFLGNPDSRRLDEIPLTDIHVLDQRRVAGLGVFYAYSLSDASSVNEYPGRDDITYIGLAVDDYTPPGVLHHIGFFQPETLHEFEISTSRLFDREVMKLYLQKCLINGSSCTFYLTKENGGISSYMNVSATVFERDLDGDGVEEAIVITRLNNEIYLFKEKDDQIEWASVRETLGLGEDEKLIYEPSTKLFRVESGAGSPEPSTKFYKHNPQKQQLDELKLEIIDQ